MFNDFDCAVPCRCLRCCYVLQLNMISHLFAFTFHLRIVRIRVMQVPTHDPKTGRNRVMATIPILLVHEMLVAMIVGGGQQLSDFIPDVASPIYKVLEAACDRVKIGVEGVIPLGIHGDGVPRQKRRSLQVWSWNSLANPLAERILFTVVPKEFCCRCGCWGL